MPIDQKYGRVEVERGTIGEDEPVVVFRARDAALLPTLQFYRNVCLEAGSPAHHIDLLGRAMSAVAQWQHDHDTRVPQSSAHAPSAAADHRADSDSVSDTSGDPADTR